MHSFSKSIFLIFSIILLIFTIGSLAKEEEEDHGYLITLEKGLKASEITIEDASQRRRVLSSIPNIVEFFSNEEDDNKGGIRGQSSTKIELQTILAVTHLSESDVESLKSNPKVISVEKNEKVQAYGSQIVTSSEWNLDRADSVMDLKYEYPGDGSDVDVFVIDTGIRKTHDEFEDRVIEGVDCLTGSGTCVPGGGDCDGHGTHVASTVAGKTYGIAKKANLYSAAVLNCAAVGWWSDIIAGIDWSISQAKSNGRKAVFNLSLGGGKSISVNAAIANAYANGFISAVAAGNSADDSCDYSPASEVTAVTVGSTSKPAVNQKDYPSYFSNYGSCNDIYAPGSSIKGASVSCDSCTVVMSGTSMASPYVAGVLAILHQLHPSKNIDEIVTLMKSTADDTVHNTDLKLAILPPQSTTYPTIYPSASSTYPTIYPSASPYPTSFPSQSGSTVYPTIFPSNAPTDEVTIYPTSFPTEIPSPQMTDSPTYPNIEYEYEITEYSDILTRNNYEYGNSWPLLDENPNKSIYCLKQFSVNGIIYKDECVTDYRTPNFGNHRNVRPKNFHNEKMSEGWCYTNPSLTTWAICSTTPT